MKETAWMEKHTIYMSWRDLQKRIAPFVQIEHLDSESVPGSSVKIVKTILVYTQENVFNAITR